MSSTAFFVSAARQDATQPDNSPSQQHYSYAMTDNRMSLIVVGIVFTSIGRKFLNDALYPYDRSVEAEADANTVVTMTLRFLSTRIRHRLAGKDDWAMLFAWLCSVGFTVASFVSVRWGVGLRLSDAPPSWGENAIKVSLCYVVERVSEPMLIQIQAVYAVEIFYYFSIFLIKISIIFLYLRLGQASRLKPSMTPLPMLTTEISCGHSYLVLHRHHRHHSSRCRPIRLHTGHYWRAMYADCEILGQESTWTVHQYHCILLLYVR